MTQKFTLNKKDRAFVLKMIMVADMSTQAYRYLSKNPTLMTDLESRSSNQLPADFVNRHKDKKGNILITEVEKEKPILDKLINIIRTSPKSTEISLPFSKVFKLIGFFEEEVEETTKFNELAAENPSKALKYLKEEAEFDFEDRIKSLVAEIRQNAGQVTFDPSTTDNENEKKLLASFQKRIETMLLVFSEYSSSKTFFKSLKEMTQTFFESFLGLAEKFEPILGEKKSNFLNKAVELAPVQFWQEILTLPNYANFDGYKNLLSSLNNEILLDSSNVGPIFNKLPEFLETTNFDSVMQTIEEYDLMSAKSANDFRSKLATFFNTRTDPNQRRKLFDLLKKDKKIIEEQNIIIKNLLDKTEYAMLNEALIDDEVRRILFSTHLEEFKKFITSTADFNNREFYIFFSSLWKTKYISESKILDKSFFDTIATKISQVAGEDLKNQYTTSLIKKDLVNIILETGAKNVYVEGLKRIIYPKVDRKHKTKITKFNISLEGGESNGRKNRKSRRRK